MSINGLHKLENLYRSTDHNKCSDQSVPRDIGREALANGFLLSVCIIIMRRERMKERTTLIPEAHVINRKQFPSWAD